LSGSSPRSTLNSPLGCSTDTKRLEAELAALKGTPSVHCVAYDSNGKPMDTVHLLGDGDAVLGKINGVRQQARQWKLAI
jgi:hypothetical protein